MQGAELMALLKDLTLLVREKYNDTLGGQREGESEADYQCSNG